jgi:FecR protein
MTRSFVRTALVLALPVALAGGPALARVGVTSATDGDPLGKPPTENERVLRMGIDIQADEVVTTTTDDRAHLVFLDGTSLTIGPNARVVIDKFVYDPNTKTGELALTAGKGVFRLVGGKISKTNPITVKTPSSTIGIRGGISIFSVNGGQTIANFIFGHNMTVTGSGQTQTATRPGSQVIINTGTPPGLPSLLPPGGLANDLKQLETGKSDSSGGKQGTGGLANTNSGQPFNVPPSNLPPLNVQNNVVPQSKDQTLPGNTTPPPGNPPAPPPEPKTTQTLNGYVGGLIVNQRGETSTTRSTEALLARPGDLVISTDAQTGQVKGKIVIRTIDGIVPVTTTLQMGTTPNNANNFFTDDKRYAMTTSNDPRRPSTVQVLGSAYTIRDNSALVSNAVNVASSQPVLVRGTPGACTCAYMTWGWWQTTYRSGLGAGQTNTVRSAPYVAGTLATAVQLPMTGTATYNGFMVGNVQNGSQFYNAAGSYSSSWSFQNRAGSFNASFDNRSYVGAIAATPGTGGVSFVGGMVGTGGLVGTLSGSFFSGGGDAAKYQGGAFTIGQNSSSYKASGVFAGQR